MAKYEIRFWFEHGGVCLWGMDDVTKERYGYAIKNNILPISNGMIDELNALERDYGSCLDWNCPQNPSPWTKDDKINFKKHATDVLKRLRIELGSDFSVQDCIDECIYD